MKKVEFLYLSQEDIISLQLGWDVIIKQVELANSEFVQNTVECPPKRGVHTRPDCFIHEMPVYLKTMDACGIKWVSGYPNNYKYDLPQIAGIQVINDPETGIPVCVMDCRWFTGVRTAAATAITMKYCAKSDSRKIAIIGAGVQGRMHLLAIKHVLPSIEECHIYDIKPNMVNFYIKTMTEKTDCEIIPFNSVKEAVQDVDIIVT
jgi:ornithine cyclodeaminase/alanine dehydrogenase-like protein (mu-crystallin family)